MTTKFKFIIVILCGLFFSCEPEQLPQETNAPVAEKNIMADSGNEQNNVDKRDPDEE